MSGFVQITLPASAGGVHTLRVDTALLALSPDPVALLQREVDRFAELVKTQDR